MTTRQNDGEPHTYAWGVHVTQQTEAGRLAAGPSECLHSTELAAMAYACERSRDAEVHAAGVTRYGVDTCGDRHRVALFRNGVRQQRPYCTDLTHEWIVG